VPVFGTEIEQCSILLQEPSPVKCDARWYMKHAPESGFDFWRRFLERVSEALSRLTILGSHYVLPQSFYAVVSQTAGQRLRQKYISGWVFGLSQK